MTVYLYMYMTLHHCYLTVYLYCLHLHGYRVYLILPPSIQLVETMPQTKEVEAFLKSIGPFYEVADDVSDDEEQSHDSFDPTAQVSMETKSPPTPDKGDSPLGNEEDSNEVTNRNSSPTPTNQTSEPGEEIEGEGGGRESGDKVEGDDGEGGGGESGNESDSSVDFKDSFQDLKVCVVR